MANSLYRVTKELILTGGINLVGANIRAVLVRNSYAFNITTDEFLTQVEPHVVGNPQTLMNKTALNGAFDADDLVFPAVPAGQTLRGIVLYIDSGVAATSRLIMYIDQIAGFPFLTNGGDVAIIWDNGPNKIFSI